MELTIRPMHLGKDRKHILAYAKELFEISFGSVSRFIDQFGEDGSRYIPWIAEKQAKEVGNAALALLEGRPAGMVVLGPWADDPAIGYVYHYYLERYARGRGLALSLDQYAASALSRQGHGTARLSVALSNARARHFYKKQGWVEAGPRSDQPGIIYMQRTLGSSFLKDDGDRERL
jgi:ribosomal protein S18 acetylase RimI-like enzyme